MEGFTCQWTMAQESGRNNRAYQVMMETVGRIFRQLPRVRSEACPSEAEIRDMCYEPNGGPLREKYLIHVSFCPYCVNIAREVARDILQERGRAHRQ